MRTMRPKAILPSGSGTPSPGWADGDAPPCASTRLVPSVATATAMASIARRERRARCMVDLEAGGMARTISRSPDCGQLWPSISTATAQPIRGTGREASRRPCWPTQPGASPVPGPGRGWAAPSPRADETRGVNAPRAPGDAGAGGRRSSRTHRRSARPLRRRRPSPSTARRTPGERQAGRGPSTIRRTRTRRSSVESRSQMGRPRPLLLHDRPERPRDRPRRRPDRAQGRASDGRSRPGRPRPRSTGLVRAERRWARRSGSRPVEGRSRDRLQGPESEPSNDGLFGPGPALELGRFHGPATSMTAPSGGLG